MPHNMVKYPQVVYRLLQVRLVVSCRQTFLIAPADPVSQIALPVIPTPSDVSIFYLLVGGA